MKFPNYLYRYRSRLNILLVTRGRRDRDRIIVGFTTVVSLGKCLFN